MSSGSPHAPALDHDGGYFSSIHLCRHDTVTASALDKSVHIEAAIRESCVVLAALHQAAAAAMYETAM
jgi:hypothetical protein